MQPRDELVIDLVDTIKAAVIKWQRSQLAKGVEQRECNATKLHAIAYTHAIIAGTMLGAQIDHDCQNLHEAATAGTRAISKRFGCDFVEQN